MAVDRQGCGSPLQAEYHGPFTKEIRETVNQLVSGVVTAVFDQNQTAVFVNTLQYGA